MDEWQEIREAVAYMQDVAEEYEVKRGEASRRLAVAFENAIERGLPEDEVHQAIGEAFFPRVKGAAT